MMISLTTATFVLFAIAVFVWRRRKFYILSWKIGGPMAWPVVGNIAYFMNQISFISKGFELCNEFPKFYRIWFGPHLLIFLNHPEQADAVLKSPNALDKGLIYRLFTIAIGGDGIISSKGDEWKSHRKFLNPTVQHFSLLNGFQPIFNRHLRKLVGKMEKDIVEGEIDIFNIIERSTLDTVCETTFGTTQSGDENQTSHFVESANELMHVAGMFWTKPWYHIKPIFWMTKEYTKMSRSRAFTRDYATKIVLQKVKEYQAKSIDTTDDDGFEQKMQNNFIDECLRLSMETQLFSNEDLIVESMTMLLAAFDTTALTISYLLLMLAIHPDCQQKVFDELRSIFPDQSSDVTMADLGQLDYTTNVVKETMRLHPAVPFISRTIQREMKIDNVTFPAGLEVVVPIIHIQRNRTVWGPDADKFNPDNFLPENLDSRHPSAFIAFSAGPRNCIGNKYGYMVVRFFVCWLVRHFRFSTSMRMEDIRFRMSITLKMFDGHMLRVHRREKY